MDEQQETSGIAWQDVVAVLLRRWKVIVAIFIPGLVLSSVYSFMQGPAYEASAKLMVTSARARITVSPDPRSGTTVDRVTDQDLNSEVALLRSPALVREVLEPYRDRREQPQPTGLTQRVSAALSYPFDLPGLLYRRFYHVPAGSPFEGWVQAMAARVMVTTIKGSNLIEVSYWGSQPEWTAEFVNKLITHHVERRARINQQGEALGFLEGQRQLLSEKMRNATEALERFYDREGIDSASEQRSGLRARIAELESTIATSEAGLAEGTARAQFLSQTLKTHPRGAAPEAGAAQGGPLDLIRKRILELQLQRSEWLSKFAPTSLKVQEIDRQIDEARQLLATEEKALGPGGGNPAIELELAHTQAETAAVKARVDALRTQIANYRAKSEHLDQVAPEQERLEQELNTAKESYLTYSKKVEEARFTDALDQSRIVNVSVVEPAEVPSGPQPSRRIRTVLVGIMMSLAAGAGLAFLLDRLDPAIKSATEAEKVSGLAILADIPS